MAHDHTENGTSKHGPSVVHFLERGDGAAHVAVAWLLLLLAIGILAFSTYQFVVDVAGLVHDQAAGDFPARGLEYLSELLLGVIVLELLSTILTYIQARNLEATIKDFLVVALISSIRKILMVGAQSSLPDRAAASATSAVNKTADFQGEAWGTVISIIGILLLIGGLLLLDWRAKSLKREALGEAAGTGIGGLMKGMLGKSSESESAD